MLEILSVLSSFYSEMSSSGSKSGFDDTKRKIGQTKRERRMFHTGTYPYRKWCVEKDTVNVRNLHFK
jgi:hypothetical protein